MIGPPLFLDFKAVSPLPPFWMVSSRCRKSHVPTKTQLEPLFDSLPLIPHPCYEEEVEENKKKKDPRRKIRRYKRENRPCNVLGWNCRHQKGPITAPQDVYMLCRWGDLG